MNTLKIKSHNHGSITFTQSRLGVGYLMVAVGEGQPRQCFEGGLFSETGTGFTVMSTILSFEKNAKKWWREFLRNQPPQKEV